MHNTEYYTNTLIFIFENLLVPVTKTRSEWYEISIILDHSDFRADGIFFQVCILL